MGADPVGVWLEVLLVARLIFNQEDTFESCQQYKCQDDEFKNCMNMQGANPCRDLKLGGWWSRTVGFLNSKRVSWICSTVTPASGVGNLTHNCKISLSLLIGWEAYFLCRCGIMTVWYLAVSAGKKAIVSILTNMLHLLFTTRQPLYPRCARPHATNTIVNVQGRQRKRI